MSEQAVPKQEKINGLDKWQVEDAARSLSRACEIMNDPKLFAAAKTILKKQYKGLSRMLGESEALKGIG